MKHLALPVLIVAMMFVAIAGYAHDMPPTTTDIASATLP